MARLSLPCFVLTALLTTFTAAPAQSSVHHFVLGGSAYILNDECIRLTPDVPYLSGSAWYKKALDLNLAFEMVISIVLGEKDLEGADGITFVFHPAMRTGFRGEGMGFSGLSPSLGIEFDTYQNFHLNDPAADHLAFMVNGRPFHAVGPTRRPLELANLEDGARHRLRITWNPEAQQLDVYLDQNVHTTYSGNLVQQVFGGNPWVYWGFTAATGRLSNYQDVCIEKLVFAQVK